MRVDDFLRKVETITPKDETYSEVVPEAHSEVSDLTKFRLRQPPARTKRSENNSYT